MAMKVHSATGTAYHAMPGVMKAWVEKQWPRRRKFESPYSESGAETISRVMGAAL
jgi:hypothetical protein